MTSKSKVAIVQGTEACQEFVQGMKCSTALPVFLPWLSRDSSSGFMHSQVIPSSGDKAQFRVAEGCLSVVKSQSGWERAAGKEKSARCPPFPGRSLLGEGTVGSSQSGTTP